MMYRLIVTMFAFFSAQAIAEEAIITGSVESKCVINTDVNGVYGNPSSGTLSTLPADGGIMPIIRYDVALGDAYTAKITAPNTFSTSPALSDVVAWTGDVEVSEVSDTAMADYETDKVQYEYTTEFDPLGNSENTKVFRSCRSPHPAAADYFNSLLASCQ